MLGVEKRSACCRYRRVRYQHQHPFRNFKTLTALTLSQDRTVGIPSALVGARACESPVPSVIVCVIDGAPSKQEWGSTSVFPHHTTNRAEITPLAFFKPHHAGVCAKMKTKQCKISSEVTFKLAKPMSSTPGVTLCAELSGWGPWTDCSGFVKRFEARKIHALYLKCKCIAFHFNRLILFASTRVLQPFMSLRRNSEQLLLHKLYNVPYSSAWYNFPKVEMIFEPAYLI